MILKIQFSNTRNKLIELWPIKIKWKDKIRTLIVVFIVVWLIIVGLSARIGFCSISAVYAVEELVGF